MRHDTCARGQKRQRFQAKMTKQSGVGGRVNMGEVSLQKDFPYSHDIFYLNISNSGKKSQVKIRGVSIFKIRIAGGGKTGWGYLVLDTS